MTETLKIEKTKRGFAYAEFRDQYDNLCSTQESSLATEACVWLGLDGDRILKKWIKEVEEA